MEMNAKKMQSPFFKLWKNQKTFLILGTVCHFFLTTCQPCTLIKKMWHSFTFKCVYLWPLSTIALKWNSHENVVVFVSFYLMRVSGGKRGSQIGSFNENCSFTLNVKWNCAFQITLSRNEKRRGKQIIYQ